MEFEEEREGLPAASGEEPGRAATSEDQDRKNQRHAQPGEPRTDNTRAGICKRATIVMHSMPSGDPAYSVQLETVVPPIPPAMSRRGVRQQGGEGAASAWREQ